MPSELVIFGLASALIIIAIGKLIAIIINEKPELEGYYYDFWEFRWKKKERKRCLNAI